MSNQEYCIRRGRPMSRMEIDYCSIQGKRKYMEDNFSFNVKVDGRNKIIVAYVCDGHGGSLASKRTTDSLFGFLSSVAKRYIPYSSEVKAVLIYKSIMIWGESMKNEQSGTTLTGFISDKKDTFFFNIGDSQTSAYTNQSVFQFEINPESYNIEFFKRAPNQDNGFFTTTEHSIDNEEEIKRVKMEGGRIEGGPSDPRLNGLLNLTRTIGDFGVGKGLSYKPDIYYVPTSGIVDGLVLMYSDGITEGIDSRKEIYNIATEKSIKELVNEASERGSSDNITAVMVNIKEVMKRTDKNSVINTVN